MLTLPSSFVGRMQALLRDEYPAFAEALTAGTPPVSIRVNPAKGALCPPQAAPVPWSASMGCYLPVRPTFTFDPLFHAGAYYVQEAASMFLATVIRQVVQSPVRYLDLCAAPGGKATLALSLLPAGSLVVANEYVRQRASVLVENVTKWGMPQAVVTNNDAARWKTFRHFFDVIAADVPCSGEGMFRKDPAAVDEWSPAAVAACAARQQSILDDVWDALRPGGWLIYSTCTYNEEENEAMVGYMVQRYGARMVPVDVLPSWGIHGAWQGDSPVYRFVPHLTRGEGLFMALLQKPDDEPYGAAGSRKGGGHGKKGGKLPVVPAEVKGWLGNPDDYAWTVNGDTVTAYPLAHAADMQLVRQQCTCLQAGIAVAEIKGRDYVPTQALALSTALDGEAFPACPLDRDTALAYLRRDAISLPAGTPRGYVLVTYKGFALGWVKNIGSRANNLYSREWRIRTAPPALITEAGVGRVM